MHLKKFLGQKKHENISNLFFILNCNKNHEFFIYYENLVTLLHVHVL